MQARTVDDSEQILSAFRDSHPCMGLVANKNVLHDVTSVHASEPEFELNPVEVHRN